MNILAEVNETEIGAPLRTCTAVTESVKLQLTTRPTVINLLH